MPGRLHHSAADIIRWLLVDLGIVGNPNDSPVPAWPAYATLEPEILDDLVTVYDTASIDQGRTHYDGERQEREGFQVRVRATDTVEGYDKADEIKAALDTQVYQSVVAIGANRYLVHAISRTTGVLSIGAESKESKRPVFTLNGTVSVREIL